MKRHLAIIGLAALLLATGCKSLVGGGAALREDAPVTLT